MKPSSRPGVTTCFMRTCGGRARGWRWPRWSWSARPPKLSFAKLKTKAEALTEQINYLKERLEIVDHDRRGMYIQLRSLPPYKDDHQIQFNEISIGKNRIVVKRIAFFRKEEVKQQVPLNLSEQELARLLSDIRQAIA